MNENHFKQQHEIARNIIYHRWYGERFDRIASKLNIPTVEIRKIRTTEIYEQQVHTEYGRNAYRFNRHNNRETCIRHIAKFFGITIKRAKKVLRKDWTPPPPIQIKFNL